MKCTVCKNGTYRKSTTSTMFDKDGSIVIFKNVPAFVCDNCGAKIFDQEVSSSLLKKAREARKNGAELEVINHRAA